MYCGSCLHGNTLAAALRAAGQDCLLAPMYTPLRTDEQSVSIDRVAFGGINVYLQQHSAIFRHTPWAFDRLLDSPACCVGPTGRSAQRPARAAWAADRLDARRRAGPAAEGGRETGAVARRDIRPDVVHLNNVMLVGVAREIIRRLGVPVVCSLTGEDVFWRSCPSRIAARRWSCCASGRPKLAALVAMNRYYADFMAELSPPAARADPRDSAGAEPGGHGKAPWESG